MMLSSQFQRTPSQMIFVTAVCRPRRDCPGCRNEIEPAFGVEVTLEFARMPAAKAAFFYFSIVFSCGFALGTFRVLVVAPAIGEMAAVVIELPLMLAASWHACRWVVDHQNIAPSMPQRLAMGAIALAILLVAELAVSILGFGRTVVEHVASYQNLPVQLGLFAQLAFASFPAIQISR